MDRKVVIIGPQKRGGITAVLHSLLKGGLNQIKTVVIHPSILEGSRFASLYFCIQQLFLGFLVLLKFKPDIVHINVSSDSSFYRKSCYILLAKALKKKIIIHIHPTHFLDYMNNSIRINRLIILKVLKRADVIITLTSSMRNQLSLHDGLDRVSFKVIPNPICLEDYHYDHQKYRETSTLLYLGWIIEKKGVYDLLAAAPLVKNNIKDFQLIFCGNKEVVKLRKIVLKNGLSSYVKVIDWIDLDAKRRLFSNVTALILPSYTEGIPNVILEAMASGIPIITTPVGGIPSVLTDGVNCLFFNPGNISEMAEKICLLLSDRELQRSQAENNYLAIRNYDAKLIVDRLLDVYREI